VPRRSPGRDEAYARFGGRGDNAVAYREKGGVRGAVKGRSASDGDDGSRASPTGPTGIGEIETTWKRLRALVRAGRPCSCSGLATLSTRR